MSRDRPTRMERCLVLAMLLMLGGLAHGGPPFATDDPEPTATGHYEIYFYSQGARGGEAGIDSNYGAGPGLQLTAVLSLAWDAPREARGHAGWATSNWQ